jgi:hypothetical protein
MENAIASLVRDRNPWSSRTTVLAGDHPLRPPARRDSRRGKGIAARQALGQRCERALRAGGAPGEWMVRERPK